MTNDLEAIASEWLRQCGACDAGLPMGCACSDKDYRPAMSSLVAEVERLRAEVDALPYCSRDYYWRAVKRAEAAEARADRKERAWALAANERDALHAEVERLRVALDAD